MDETSSRPPPPSAHDGWVCPNDRVLSLRAKLDVGWSVRCSPTGTSMSSRSSSILDNNNHPQRMAGSDNLQVTSALSQEETEHILSVISRAKEVELMEKERISRLTDRLKNIKRNSGLASATSTMSISSMASSQATTSSSRTCALCSERFPLFVLRGSTSFVCHECRQVICSKCVVDHAEGWSSEATYYCKICSESREIWKKSGAWFLRRFPTFPLISGSVSASGSSRNPTDDNDPSTSSSSSPHKGTSGRAPPPPPLTTRDNQVQLVEEPEPETPKSSTDSFNSLDTSITLSNLSMNAPPSPAPSTGSRSGHFVYPRVSSINRGLNRGFDDASSSRSSIGSVESLVERMQLAEGHDDLPLPTSPFPDPMPTASDGTSICSKASVKSSSPSVRSFSPTKFFRNSLKSGLTSSSFQKAKKDPSSGERKTSFFSSFKHHRSSSSRTCTTSSTSNLSPSSSRTTSPPPSTIQIQEPHRQSLRQRESGLCSRPTRNPSKRILQDRIDEEEPSTTFDEDERQLVLVNGHSQIAASTPTTQSTIRTTPECWQLSEDPADSPGSIRFNLVSPQRKTSLASTSRMMNSQLMARRTRPF